MPTWKKKIFLAHLKCSKILNWNKSDKIKFDFLNNLKEYKITLSSNLKIEIRLCFKIRRETKMNLYKSSSPQ